MRFSKLLLLVFVFLSVNPLNAYAQVADQPCDTQFWRQMSARAWMEAEREIMQNQNLIYKPDSVLEYTCFDQFVGLNAWDGGNIFTHTEYFGDQIISRGQPYGLEIALTKVVSESLNEYKDANYADSFLSGRADFLSIQGTNSEFRNASVEISSYNCETMANVWRASKCTNFIDNSAFEKTDGFYPFDVLVGLDGQEVDGYAGTIQDTRKWPASMACGPESTRTPTGTSVTIGQPFGSGGGWSDQIAVSKNAEDVLYPSKIPLGEVYKEVFDLTVPGVCANPIFTGVTVIASTGGETYADGVCTNPGCTFNKGGVCQGGEAGGNNAVYGTGGSGANNGFGVGTFNPNSGGGGL